MWSISVAFAASDSPWPRSTEMAYAALLIGGGLQLALLHGRRVAKMRPRAAAVAGASRRRVACALLAAVASAGCVAAVGHRPYVEPTLLLASGAVCWGVGCFGSAPAYRYLGGVLMTTALLAAGVQSTEPGAQPSLAGVAIIDAVLAAVVVPAACAINRRYLWHRFD